MSLLRITALFLLWLSCLQLQAQRLTSRNPYSLKKKVVSSAILLSTDSIAAIILPPYTNERLRQYADSVNRSQVSGEFSYGKAIRVNLNILEKASCQRIRNMNVYRLRIKSAHALALQFYFGDFFLPGRGSLFLYSVDKENIYGALTSKNNPRLARPVGSEPGLTDIVITVSTPPLKGNDWILEYNVPASGPQGRLVLGMVSHVFEE